ncbi:MAG: hypothetical protein WC346_03100 [Methanogenium sp.]|jgi:hypothetical protein
MRKEKQNNLFSMNANKGADYVIIESIGEEGMCHIEIGHCCTVIFDKVVPIEFLTGVFSGLILKTCERTDDNAAFNLYDYFSDWIEPYRTEIRNKIRNNAGDINV